MPHPRRMIWYEWCQSDESPILRPTLPYRSNQLAALGYQQVPQMFDQPRYKRSRSWRKPPATEPLGRLEFRTVPL